MTLKVWIGGAPLNAQEEKYTLPIDIEGGQVMTATVGYKSISYTFPGGPIRNSVITAFVALWESTAESVTEFAEIDIANNGDGSFTLTAATPGVPYDVTILIGNGTNEKQVVTMVGTITGGTFTLTFDGQTTDPIAYDASAATVQTELEALSNIEAGDVEVSGADGGPWTIEFKGNLADTDVTLLDYDDSLLEATNEQQTITLASCSGGTFALTYGEETTDPIAYNAAAATVESELEALPGIGAGNVSVSGTGPWVVEFIGTLRGTDVDQVTVDGSNLTGVLAASIAETTPGGNGVNERWWINLDDLDGQDGRLTLRGDSDVTGGTFTIQIERGSETVIQTGAIPWDASPATVQAAFEAGIVNPNAELTYIILNTEGTDTLASGDSWFVNVSQFTGDSSISVTIDSTSLVGGAYTEGLTKTTPIAPSSYVGAGASSFYLMVDGETTDDIPASATAEEIETALEALSTVGEGNVLVTRSDWTSDFTIEFLGDLANQALGLVSGPGATRGVGSDSTPAFNTNLQTMWSGSGGTSEVQTLSITGGPGSGTFALSFDDVDTDLLGYDSTAEEIETALEALPGIGAGNVTCSGGALPGSDVVITFAGAKAGLDINPITVIFAISVETMEGGGNPTVDVQTTQTILAKTVIAENSGPNDWNVAGNWDTLENPVNGDSVLVPDGDNILYGLDQSDLTLVLFRFTATDTQMGLPRRNSNGEIEYRPRYLKVTASEFVIDSNSELINIDVMDSSPTIEVLNSGSGQDGEHAVQIIGENSANTLTLLVLSGDVGVATGPKEAAYVKTITQRGGQLWIGQDVGLEDVERTGGLVHTDRTTIDGTLTL